MCVLCFELCVLYWDGVMCLLRVCLMVGLFGEFIEDVIYCVWVLESDFDVDFDGVVLKWVLLVK